MLMKLPKSYYNVLSFIGTIVASISFFLILVFVVVGYFYQDTSSYLGLFSFIIFPAFMIMGLVLIPIGMSLERKRLKKREPEYIKQPWPVIDLNVAKYRNFVSIFVVGTVFLLALTSIGSYEAFHYTESNEFCGTLCHEVMEPEYVAYQGSPHARVKCVECHVGTGADWYMRSKLSGLRQVYGVLTNDFNRPIETPIHNLRPARETCEKCHWPEKFYARTLRQTSHFLTDSINTEWNIGLQMKTGPEHSALGLSEGIHWHINSDIKIEYIPKRDNRKAIPWVKYTNLATGKEIIYEDEENALSEKKMAAAEVREMDCMDCHNRPSHNYFSPQEFVDEAMIAGDIPKDLPFIKKIAMDILKDPFENKDTALLTIEQATWDFYRENYPEISKTREADINTSIASLKTRFSQNIFPAMGASWDEYESHIGHKTYNGCFRCHDDNHKAPSGQIIRKDCNICHTIVLQGTPDNPQFASIKGALDFVHPKELKDGWEEDVCAECHRYLY
jgi:nitrate/TMAO reductase-like tetraheme cytochrome c subunit